MFDSKFASDVKRKWNSLVIKLLLSLARSLSVARPYLCARENYERRIKILLFEIMEITAVNVQSWAHRNNRYVAVCMHNKRFSFHSAVLISICLAKWVILFVLCVSPPPTGMCAAESADRTPSALEECVRSGARAQQKQSNHVDSSLSYV